MFLLRICAYSDILIYFREEKTEILAEYKEELEHATNLVTKLKAEVSWNFNKWIFLSIMYLVSF